MGLEDIFAVLEEDSKKEREELIAKANKQAADIVKEAEEEAGKIVKVQIDKLSGSLKKEQTRIINEAKLANQREITTFKEGLIDKVFAEVKEKLNELRRKDVYQKIFQLLVKEALAGIKAKKIEVWVDKKDEDLAKKVLDGLNLNYKLNPDLDCLGGLKVSIDEGRMLVVNTFDSRLEKIKKFLQPQILDLLFPAKT